ncbi:MAG: nucleotidyltransferase [Verrucomicrobia bacterium]|jgi:predicted nucleotidyltransferase|nr:nucleotidyltransferase [Verrucomicrobiota bacterium]
MTTLTEDMVEFLGLLKKHGVEFVLVGGHAVNYYGYVRTTQDIDLLIYPSPKNAQCMMAALSDFGFGDAGIPVSLFESTGSAIHLGNEPNRIDLLTALKGMSNEQIFKNKKRIHLGSLELDIIDLNDLLQIKRQSSRLKDQADAEEIEKSKPDGDSYDR